MTPGVFAEQHEAIGIDAEARGRRQRMNARATRISASESSYRVNPPSR